MKSYFSDFDFTSDKKAPEKVNALKNYKSQSNLQADQMTEYTNY